MGAEPGIAAELPGAELVVAGLADLAAGRETSSAAAVAMASQRLRAIGLEVPAASWSVPPSHRLYELLAGEDPRNAHSHYNAIVRRLVSFARAAERARRR